MPIDRPEQPEPDSLARARLVNAACERHEAAWRAGRRPRIEEELDRVTARERPELLAELLALEVELRRSQGERPKFEEYLARFPGQEAAIAAAFGAPGEGERGGHRDPIRSRRHRGGGADARDRGRGGDVAARIGPPRPGLRRLTSCWRRSRGAAWGSSTGPGRRASTASSP